MSEFAKVLNLTSLNGSNGFQINGNVAGGISGLSVAGIGDVNGDGLDDMLIGAPDATSFAPNEMTGESYLVFGKRLGFPANLNLTPSSFDGTNVVLLQGEKAKDRSGNKVSSAGDINGDGFNDFLIASPNADPMGKNYAGAVHVVFGTSQFPATFALSAINGSNGFQLSGLQTYDGLGLFSATTLGDLNGDGFDDIVIGAPYAGANAVGTAYVIFGKAGSFGAHFNLSGLNGTNGFKIAGPAPYSFGPNIAGAGDFNGDGFDDLLIDEFIPQAHGTPTGASYVVFGKKTGFAANFKLPTLNGTNGFRITGDEQRDFARASVDTLGDVNGDGLDDIVVRATTADFDASSESNNGISYVIFGRKGASPANVELSSLDGSNGFKIVGKAQSMTAGAISAGDVNGDSFDDIMIIKGGVGAGVTYVIFGKATFTPALFLQNLDGSDGFQIVGEKAGDGSGSSASPGDVNGDGFGDLIIGSPGADLKGVNSGTTHVVFGHRAHGAVVRVGTALSQTINGGMGDDFIEGKAGNDRLIGWEDNDEILGGTGNDVIDGGEGHDNIQSGVGNDTIRVSAGNDVLNGGPGSDWLSFEGLNTGITIALTSNAYTLSPAGDQQTFGSIENIEGSGFADRLTGNVQDNRLLGDAGNDTIQGGGGNDTIRGGADRDSINGAAGNDIVFGEDANDRMFGGVGNDTLIGGLGQDIIASGPGRDIIKFNTIAESGPAVTARDQVTDFARLDDKIDLSAIDANPASPGNNAFAFIGQSEFTSIGQVRAVQASGRTIVEINASPGVAPEMAILLLGVEASKLTGDDFIL